MPNQFDSFNQDLIDYYFQIFLIYIELNYNKQVKTYKIKKMIEGQICRINNYSIRMLTMKDKEQVIQMYSNESDKRQPISQAYYRRFNQYKRDSLQHWVQYIIFFSEELLNSKLSVGCFDMSNDNELIGVCLAKRINYDKVYQLFKKQSFTYPTFIFAEKMFNNVAQNYSNIIIQQSNKIIDIWGIAIKHQHTGKKLLHQMMKANEYLASLQNLAYSVCWASNFKTGVALMKLDYLKILEMNAGDFQVEGIKYFEQIEKLHQLSTLWIKKL